ncbi:calcium/sodium antiporter [Pelagibacterium limicola]|uniref:calcium/sodium antiporter n=1 Tax=Pelagibacterium limicola TaxID=2791022 RepID=UPI0018AFCF11|nr:calcium/sodium antiporter [Pelagibacterium limicola]
MVYLTLIAGFVLLIAGGESFVRGSVAVAYRFGMSTLLVGLTLVAFGTSLPELVTSVQAALAGAPGIAVGNVVGSNIANILLILGVTAAIYPVLVSKRTLRRDGGVLVIASLACLATVLIGIIERITGVIFVAMLIAYIVRSYMVERGTPVAARTEAPPESARRANLAFSLLLTVAGIGLTLAGARLLVSSAVELATQLGVSETVIGLTVVALGTSLPELVTSGIAALRRQTDLALGNIIGSNIFNVLCIMGITALVQPIPVPPEIIRFDIWAMLAATALLLVLAYTGRGVSRREGWVFLACYAAYIGWLALNI